MNVNTVIGLTPTDEPPEVKSELDGREVVLRFSYNDFSTLSVYLSTAQATALRDSLTAALEPS